VTFRAAIPAVVLLALSGRAAPVSAADAADLAEVERIEREIGLMRARLGAVRDFAERGEMSSLERARRRFSEAETQFLLENYEGCAAMLRDVVEAGPFQQDPLFATALYYLGESLYQRQSWLEARRYLREAAGRQPPGRQLQDTIVRLIDLADRTGDAQGIDQYFEAAQRGGTLRPEVAYLYAKWTSRRRDLPADTRAARAGIEFGRLKSGEAYYPQALFFRGALAVQRGRLDEAAGFFTQLLELPEPARNDDKGRKLRDLANLALARVYYEQGKFPEAVDRYHLVSTDSNDFNDAMFETAATYVRMGNFEQALRTSDILLRIGKDSPVAPEARILQGNLLLRMAKNDTSAYAKASEAFNEVVNTYGPVRDQIRSVLERPDPVEYFDTKLREGGESMDIEQMLPRDARPWVSTNREVAGARSMAGELKSSRVKLSESRELVEKLDLALAAANINLFPALQDGNAMSVTVSNQLATLESQLVSLELKLLGAELPSDLRDRLLIAEQRRRDLATKILQLPTNEEEYQERRARMVARVAELERTASEMTRELDFMRTLLNGLSYTLTRARDVLDLQPGEEKETLERIQQDLRLLEQIDERRRSVAAELESQRATVAAQATGGELEDALRTAYKKQLAETQDLVNQAVARVGTADAQVLKRIGNDRLEIESLQTQLAAVRDALRQKAVARLAEYRTKVAAERVNIEEYQREVAKKDGATRQLLGRIANDSFSRVARQFYELVLKGDVGLIDVAWARKRERSDRITQLARDKEAELQELESRFREVRADAD
jgi:tetratricopeptide (TPR) repeat protein